MRSLWTDNTKLPQFSSLSGSKKTDVLIIGGGMAGLLCAYLLERAGVENVLVESGRICSGVTGNTTAKLTLQHGLIYSKITEKYGEETAAMYLGAQRAAADRLTELCRKSDCDYTESDSYVYSRTDRGKIERETAALQKLGCDADFCERTELPFEASAVRVKGQAYFHPLKLVASVAKGLNIYENTRVMELRPDGAVTPYGKIKAEKIIVATHFPFLNKHGSYFLKMYQHRSYVLALKNAPKLEGMYVDECDTGLSFRSHGDMLLLGGGGHRTGKNGGNWRELTEAANRYYPKASEEYRWATQDCMTLDGMPYIGQYSKRTPGLYVATGFNKWGMTSSMAAAMILRDLISGKQNDYAPAFSPSRSILHPQLISNALESTLNLLTPTAPRCPHLGCALKYNRAEHTWDCPCHGSRFSEQGRLLSGPANADHKKTLHK